MCPKAVALGCWAVWMVILSVPTPGRASGSSLDGIMVLRLVDADAAQVINGHELGDNPYLAVYVSGEGTYAAVGNKARRSCIAWAREGSYTGTSITFGLPPTEQTVEQYPSICQPFTLSLEADGTPRITAENAVGSSSPLAPGAQTVRYSRRQKIVAHAPLLSMD